MIANLQWQVARFTQHLVTQNIGNREMEDLDSVSKYENLYNNLALFREYGGREEHQGDLGFRVDLSKFFGTQQAKHFID